MLIIISGDEEKCFDFITLEFLYTTFIITDTLPQVINHAPNLINDVILSFSRYGIHIRDANHLSSTMILKKPLTYKTFYATSRPTINITTPSIWRTIRPHKTHTYPCIVYLLTRAT